jgi:D-beta-D-heptose 7-phosphate kinase/D-beta-D-heptose 1-phosphate adenosyltransferase
MNSRARDKVIGRRALARVLQREQRRGRRVVFTSGCFDLLHIGHVRSFESAARHGDVLVVGINRDRRVRELKGPSRPITPERQRAEVVAALGVVDYVTLFSENDASAAIRALRPDVVCKGGEYRGEQIPEESAVLEIGGEFVSLRQTPGVRTTSILKRARH